MAKQQAYRLQPVPPPNHGSMSTACVMQCLATGEFLSGSGGGSDYLSPAVVQALRDHKYKIDELGRLVPVDG